MSYKLLWVLIEGPDDENFFKNVIKPKILLKYDSVKFWKYTGKSNIAIDNFLKSIKDMNKDGDIDSDYMFVKDLDSSTGIKTKKQKLLKVYKKLDVDKIIFVVFEIESWYLAGVCPKTAKRLRIICPSCTENTTKECFNKIIPKKIDRKCFMLEILSSYNLDVAITKNKSFEYFINTYLPCYLTEEKLLTREQYPSIVHRERVLDKV